MTTSQVTVFMQMIESGADDLMIAEAVLEVLGGYRQLTSVDRVREADLLLLIDLFTAIRIDQIAKENRT